jgi:hypothetical protein
MWGGISTAACSLSHRLIVAVDRHTSKKLAIIQTNLHPLAIVTISVTFYSGHLFVDSASSEEAATAIPPNYSCCSFIGNILSFQLDPKPLQSNVSWNMTMIPDSKGGAK